VIPLVESDTIQVLKLALHKVTCVD